MNEENTDPRFCSPEGKLFRAALKLIIDEEHWVQGTFKDNDRYCAIGAVNGAIGDGYPNRSENFPNAAARAVVGALRRTTNIVCEKARQMEAYIKANKSPSDSASPVIAFNDASPVIAFNDASPVIAFNDASPVIAFNDASPVIAFNDASPVIAFNDASPVIAFNDATDTKHGDMIALWELTGKENGWL